MNNRSIIRLAAVCFLATACQSHHKQKMEQEWQTLNDTIAAYSHKIEMITKVIQESSGTTEATQQSLLHDIDSIDKLMKEAILETAERNKDNELGQYIREHFSYQ